MNPIEIEKAENLSSIPRAFGPEPLKESALSRFYCENTMAIRTGDEWNSPLDNLFEDCITPLGENAHLLLGHRGCGKSTELYQLKKRLEDAGQPAWIIDAEKEMDIYQVNCWDIMLNITEGLCGIANNNNIKIPDATLVAVFDYIKKDTEKIDETGNTATAEVSGGVGVKTPSILGILLDAFVSVKSELKANTVTRTIIKEKMEKRASEWINYIKEISDCVVRGLNGKQPVLIFENLDKLQPPEKAFSIFHYHVLAKMTFPIIYTFPVSLYYAPEFASIKNFYKPHILPMIKVSNKDKSENEEGIKIIREIVELRADGKLFDKKALDLLIKKTGGALRDLFECIVIAARRARRRGVEKIEEEDARRVLDELRSEMSRQIYQADYPKLVNIYNSAKYREQIEDVQFLLQKMQTLTVLEYNGDRWHDLHPLIAEFLINQRVIIPKEQGAVNE